MEWAIGGLIAFRGLVLIIFIGILEELIMMLMFLYLEYLELRPPWKKVSGTKE